MEKEGEVLAGELWSILSFLFYPASFTPVILSEMGVAGLCSNKYFSSCHWKADLKRMCMVIWKQDLVLNLLTNTFACLTCIHAFSPVSRIISPLVSNAGGWISCSFPTKISTSLAKQFRVHVYISPTKLHKWMKRSHSWFSIFIHYE